MSSAENSYFALVGLSTALAVSLYFLIPALWNVGSVPRGPVVPGLRNWANWCFCNSVVQSLSSIPSFRKWLDQNIPPQNEMKEDEKKLLQDDDDDDDDEKVAGIELEDLPLSRTMRGMIRVLNVEGPAKILSSSPLVQAVERVQGSRISRAQQDAQEFLHMLLESIAAEQNDLPVSVSLQQMAAAAEREQRPYRALPFEGVIRDVSECTACGHELKTQLCPFLELTLLPPGQSRITIEECLDTTFRSEMIEDYNCVHCQLAQLGRTGTDTTTFERALAADRDYDLPRDVPKSHVTLRRTATVSVLPQILILHINRSLFGSYATRNSIDVTYAEDLRVRDREYRLRSFVTHSGSHDRGHYISYRRKAGRWYVISDETVRVVDLGTVLNMGSSTFLLFYEQVDAVSLAEKEERREEKKNRKKKNRKRRKSGDQQHETTGDSLESVSIRSKI